MTQQQTNGGVAFERFLEGISACRLCRDEPIGHRLPHEPRPVLRAQAGASLCVAGQAPGVRVHATGIPFTDPSGGRLRDWMAIDRSVFYDETKIAIIPMGFCFPGLNDAGSDLPPRKECSRTWRDRLFARLTNLRLVLAIGAYAQAYHLGALAKRGVTETVHDWLRIGEKTMATKGRRVVPLPHPSWRNSGWLKKNPWFASDLLPELQRLVALELATTD